MIMPIVIYLILGTIYTMALIIRVNHYSLGGSISLIDLVLFYLLFPFIVVWLPLITVFIIIRALLPWGEE